MLKVLIKDSAIYGGTDFLAKMIAFVTFPIISTQLGPANYGRLELILTVCGIVSLIASCGINNAVQRYYWDDVIVTDSERPLIITTGYMLLVFLCLLSFVTVLISIGILSNFSPMVKDNKDLILLGVIVALLNLTIVYVIDYFRLIRNKLAYFLIALPQKVFPAILGVLFLSYLENDIETLLSAHVLVVSIISMVCFFIVLRLVSRKHWCSFLWIKNIFSYGYPYIFAGLAYWIFSATDRWMITAMLSEESTGYYAVASRFSTITMIVSTAFGLAWSPLAMKIRSENKNSYQNIFFDVLLLLFFLLVLIAGLISVFSGEIVTIVMGHEFKSSVISISLLSFGLIFNSTQQVTAIGISISQKTKIFAVSSWVVAVINILMNYALIPIFGIEGAAMSTLLTYLCLTAFYFFLSYRFGHIAVNAKRSVFAILTALLLLIYSLLLIRYQLSLGLIIGKFLGFIAIFFIGAWFSLKEVRFDRK